jgi:hypothetical protein
MDEEKVKPIEPLSGPPAKTEYREAPGGACSIYANYADISWTAFDIQVQFSHNQRLPNTEVPTNRIEHRATVSLAWPQAKLLAATLVDLIKKYETNNGIISPNVKLP